MARQVQRAVARTASQYTTLGTGEGDGHWRVVGVDVQGTSVDHAGDDALWRIASAPDIKLGIERSDRRPP